MLALGFETCRYHPFERKLELLGGTRTSGGNTLYVRDVDKIVERIRMAPAVRVLDLDI